MTTANILFFIIIFGVGVWVLAHVSRTLLRAGQDAHDLSTAKRLVSGLWVWAGLAVVYALVAGESFLWLAPSLFIPLVVVVGMTFTRSVSAVLRHAQVHRLVGVQVYRTAGSVFLMSHFWFDSYLSRAFAVNAGWGDVLTGVLALPVAYAAWKKLAFWPVLVVAWCVLGISDLVAAPVTAQLYGGPRSNDFPINAIPIFFGPPVGIILHLVTLRVLWLRRAATVVNQR